MSAKQRVAVCVPSGNTWTAPMAFQALCLAIHATAHVHVMPIMLAGDDTAQARNKLVRMARRAGADWVLWLDNDMVFPPDSLVRLLAHDLDIVGVDYRSRGAPFRRIGVFLDGSKESRERDSGLLEMGVIGFGLILMRAAMFEQMPSPWFARTWAKEHSSLGNPDGFSTEDAYFCHCARQYGHRTWCDLDLSKEVQHVGEAVVPFDLPSVDREGVTAAA